jgi:hypothetical protein
MVYKLTFSSSAGFQRSAERVAGIDGEIAGWILNAIKYDDLTTFRESVPDKTLSCNALSHNILSSS